MTGDQRKRRARVHRRPRKPIPLPERRMMRSIMQIILHPSYE